MLALALLLSTHALPEARLFNDWTIEMSTPKTTLERFQEYRVGGIEKDSDGRHFYIADPTGAVQKRELKTGAIAWSTRLEGVSQAHWLLNEGQLFGGDTQGYFYCLDASNGKVIWKAATKGIFFSRAAVSGNLVLAMNSLGSLQAFEKESGQWAWQQSDPSISSTSLWSFQGPIVLRSTVIAGFPSSLLQAIDIQSGNILWKESFSQLPSGIDSINDIKAVAATESVLISSSFGGDLKAFDLKNNRKPLWTKSYSLHSPPTIDENSGVVYLAGRDGSIRSLDLRSGLEKWKVELPRGLGTSVTRDASDHLWVASSEGVLFVLSMDGKIITRAETVENPIWNPPLALSDGSVLTLTTQGILRKTRLNLTKI